MGVAFVEFVKGDPVIQDRLDTLILRYELGVGVVLLGKLWLSDLSFIDHDL